MGLFLVLLLGLYQMGLAHPKNPTPPTLLFPPPPTGNGQEPPPEAVAADLRRSTAMGIKGRFWDLLKPYARWEDVDFLRDKRVAVDLPLWVVQHQTAIGGRARNPHLRALFFRTINLFAKLGAYPVFVVDGAPSPLKGPARAERFLRGSGLDLPVVGEGVPVPRNRAFTSNVEDCVELLGLMGMPVLRAEAEAEALCARLNGEGHVDACITSDSDAFLYGAQCVIKSIHPNTKNPFECYHMSDIEAGLGLGRKQLVAMALLVGNDHDLVGVPGIGIETALRFVQQFSDDEVLYRLQEVGNNGRVLSERNAMITVDSDQSALVLGSALKKVPHCSNCGHPGSKKDHLKLACEYCNVCGDTECFPKPVGFKCECVNCSMGRNLKELMKSENWQEKVCEKISSEKNFPNKDIVDMYLRSTNEDFFSEEKYKTLLFWDDPKIEAVIDYLLYHQNWNPSYIRQRIFPMLSTIFLRKVAAKSIEGLLLHEQYEFHSIQRIRIKYGHDLFLVKWKRVGLPSSTDVNLTPIKIDPLEDEVLEGNEVIDVLDVEEDVLQIAQDGGDCFLLTDENMDLVKAAFPEEVENFLLEKERKQLKSKRNSSVGSGHGKRKSESGGTQLSIPEFFRATKANAQVKNEEGSARNLDDFVAAFSRGKNATDSPRRLPKSVRRRLLFD